MHCLGIPAFTETMTTPPFNICFLHLVKKSQNLDFKESRLEFQEMKTKRMFMIKAMSKCHRVRKL
jgi:hypothetical protein